MIAVLATIHARNDRVTDFQAIAQQLEDLIAAHESDWPLYRMTRRRIDPLTYRNFEIFSDQAAFETPRAADGFRAATAQMRDCASRASTVEFSDTLRHSLNSGDKLS
jgi:quinol monooxygenase YgiN